MAVGVAIGDVNQDGLPDLFFTSNQGPNKLFINLVTHTTESAGIKNLVTGPPSNHGGRKWRWLARYLCLWSWRL